MKTKDLGNWGKMYEVNNFTHITQTNTNSSDGLGAHISTCVPGTPIKIHDFFDRNGNYLGNDYDLNGW
jgi:hypothetical protein